MLSKILAGAGLLLAIAFVVLLALAGSDRRAAAAAWQELTATRALLPERFDPTMVAGLPEPARRFFLFAIEPGARLGTVAELTMQGELSLGTRDDPDYLPMQARQVLASPHGLVWQVEAGSGLMQISGSDGMVGRRSWTRFRLLGLVPLVRAGGDADHLRSSFGRVVAEAAFWAPASLLPQPHVSWRAVDADTARATVTYAGLRQDVDIRVDAEGRPLWVRLPRWSNANPAGVWQEQPFGGEVSDFRQVDGYRVPSRVDGGNFFGTPEYFPFYRARVIDIRIR